ncbi:TPA: type IV pilus twitching motility protein PilT [Candidatus Poribacteria bacterium]|nr:type IV pilus twitching motility protein PilT [Candidatus Poribacteria bacterium]HEX29645.1 type IV pilus twitching motility protein PilT [Candidatus Poribacteria bacterium]
MSIDIEKLLKIAVDKGASDIHIRVGRPPGLRIDGELLPVDLFPPLTLQDVEGFIESITGERGKRVFQEKKELDFAFGVEGLARFRVNLFRQRGTPAAVLRLIPFKVKGIRELSLPPVVADLAMKPRGLILVVGPTGSGKSTTLAAMIDHINSNARKHIITIEDPIEFWHEDKLSYISQRQVGQDTASFYDGLKYALREDPDVILIGELRDLETTMAAISAAETGHLVLTTLHTIGADQTVDRIIDMYPAQQQEQIRIQLSMTLQGVLSHALLPRKDSRGRVLALEIMVATPAIRSLIREGKTHLINAQIQTGGEFGMQTLDQALRKLYLRGLISYETAMGMARNPEELARMLRGAIGWERQR